MLRVFFLQSLKHKVHRTLKLRIVLSCLRCVYHFKKCGEILFFLRCFIKDISDQGRVEKAFRFRPEILTGFFTVAFGVHDDGVYQLQNILFTAKICKGIVTHGFFEIDSIQHLDLISASLKQLSAGEKQLAFRIGNHIGAVHLHKGRLYKKSRLSAA